MTDMAKVLPAEILKRALDEAALNELAASRRHQQRGAVPAVECGRAPSPAKCCASTPGNIFRFRYAPYYCGGLVMRRMTSTVNQAKARAPIRPATLPMRTSQTLPIAIAAANSTSAAA